MNKSKKKSLAILSILVVAALALALACGLARPDNRAHVFFLDVGQGDAALIRQGSLDILIDGGPSPQALMSELGRHMPFWDRTIELVVMTHPHQDHLAGLVEVLTRYKVITVLEPPVMASDDYDAALYEEWRRLIEEKQIESITAAAHQRLTLGDVIINVLNPVAPPLEGTASDTDNNAVALEVAIGEMSFLFTSDLQMEGEAELVSRRLVPDCDVLKVAHHGSDTSSGQAFLNVARPELAVISVGQNDYGHPATEVTARLSHCRLYRTDECGTVEFITDGKRLWLKAER